MHLVALRGQLRLPPRFALGALALKPTRSPSVRSLALAMHTSVLKQPANFRSCLTLYGLYCVSTAIRLS